MRLSYGGISHKTHALVDSGADDCIFDARWAAAFGITLNPAAAVMTGGTAGSAPTYYVDMELTVLGRTFPARVGFMPTHQHPFGLLGRADFFNAFQVGFDQRGRLTLLRPLGKGK